MYAAKQRHATFLRCDDANNIDINFLFVNGHISVQVLLIQKIKNAHAQNSDPGFGIDCPPDPGSGTSSAAANVVALQRLFLRPDLSSSKILSIASCVSNT